MAMNKKERAELEGLRMENDRLRSQVRGFETDLKRASARKSGNKLPSKSSMAEQAKAYCSQFGVKCVSQADLLAWLSAGKSSNSSSSPAPF